MEWVVMGSGGVTESMREKGVGRGWWGPPKGTHGPGSLGGEVVGIQRMVDMVKVDPEVTNLEEAQAEIENYAEYIPQELLAMSEMKSLVVYSDPLDASEEIMRRYPGESDGMDPGSILGVYDRGRAKAIVSLWISEDSADSGRNFYHEFAHSLGAQITSGGWEGAWHEWSEYGQDEGFALAFAEKMVINRTEPGDKAWFAEKYPATDRWFRELGI